MNVSILPKNVQNLRHWLTYEMGNLKGFSNWHSTQSLIFGYDPNLSSWKHCRTTVNNSLHKSSTISQAKNSVKQHRIQNYFYAHILTMCTKQNNIQNYFYADILTCTDNLHNSKVLTSLCKHCPLERKSPKKQRNKQFNNYLYSTSIHRETQNKKNYTSHFQSRKIHVIIMSLII